MYLLTHFPSVCRQAVVMILGAVEMVQAIHKESVACFEGRGITITSDSKSAL
jgi:hypothetical protein